VHLVAAGGAMFGPAVAQRVIDFLRPAPPASVGLTFPQLTDREYEILDLLAQGQSNVSIARLHVSNKTVRNHVSNIFTSWPSPTAPRQSSGLARPASAAVEVVPDA
jgi:DNA-binding NarL/FixJ family response regulator